MTALTACVSSSAADRLSAAREFLRARSPGTRVLIVGASRGAADDLARSIAATVPATFGLERLSLTQLAARTAMTALAAERMTPSTPLGAEAVATRAVFEAVADGSLRYFEPVAGTPGFPRALARTLQELRLARVAGDRLLPLPLGGRDLAVLLERFESCFSDAAMADRAHLFGTAARLARARPVAEAVVLLDLALEHSAERELVEAVIGGALAALATVPGTRTRDLVTYFEGLGAAIETRETRGTGDLACVRRFLFETDGPPPQRTLDGSLELFSAPGEGREAVEIARRILQQARRGVPFDEMAILVRSPHSYFGLIEHALARAGVPGWFDRGTRRPHPAGRAFLALLACRAEELSAARFAEYLSLGQVPQPDAGETTWVPSLDDAFTRVSGGRADEPEAEEAQAAANDEGSGSSPIAAGTLRAPWKWERLIVEAAVIGRGAARWRRRLDGKAQEIERQLAEAARLDGEDSAKVRALVQTREQLHHLRTFALPIVETLEEWPERAAWGEWLDRFEALVPRVLRAPAHVLRVLADLRPMSEVGPIGLDEARRVLGERLLTVESEPPARRFGRVFVGTPEQARGRSFRVVFVPGLAERMFPQKRREDPLLLDEQRAVVGSQSDTPPEGRLRPDTPREARSRPDTAGTRDGSHEERLLLQLAVGAASECRYVSYPRMELSESRARVPSFYALDVMRAATGVVPDHEALEERARQIGNATLAWPAPARPEEAIDEQEHDLATLRRLLDHPDPASVRGHAHYLLKLNECLRRSVVDRWARGAPRWSPNDGLTRVTPYTAAALAARRLTARPYSVTALQRFTACPYQFVLSAFYRLEPLEQPEPFQRMDPLTRGSLFHDIQAGFLRELAARHELPVTPATVASARPILDGTIDRVTGAAHQDLAPAVERVWHDEVGSLRRDLHAWLDRAALDGEEWEPKYFELAFGRVRGERDAASIPTAVTLDGGYTLNGAIDLVEEHRTTKVLRVTDHKTGRKPDRIEKAIVNGGAVLQPVLYAMVVEAALQRPVAAGRLFYCTPAGGFSQHAIPLDERSRAAGLEVLQVIDRAIAHGSLAAAPTEDACGRCSFRPVCGPGVFARVRRKPREALADLLALRSRP